MSDPSGGGDYALLVLGADDTVAVAVRDLPPGSHRTSSGGVLDVVEPVGLGHKVARHEHAEGTPVIRSGMVIGVTTRPVGAGAWVHTHNLASTYIVTYAHRGGAE